MRVMVLVKASEESENGAGPDDELLTAMGEYNGELVRAGVMLAGDGLLSSAHGKRVRFESDGATAVIDGPFAETKELIAGFWIWQVASIEEAVEWLKRAPFRGAEIEIRRVAEADDFEALTPELRAAEAQLRAEVAAGQS